MPMIFNPLLEFGFEEKDDIRILMKDSEGNEIDITDYVANLNQEVAKKVNIFQGSNAGNKVMVTDAQGNVTNVAGVVMNQSEREKLAAMTNPMLLKGIVESYEALYQIANPQVGWTYLVPFLENGENIHKEYVYTASNRWELIGNFNLNMIQHYYSGTATDIDNAHNVNILFNPDTFEVDSLNRLNIKDFSYVRKCTQQSEINAVEIGSIFHWQGVDNQSIIVEDTNGNQTYIQYGFFYKKEADKIVLVNKEPVKDSLAVDVNVSTWSEFVTAVQNSATIATRIHFISNITVSSSETLDLSNCIIYGHYKEWDVADYEITIRGNYANFNNLLFRGASVLNVSLPLFTIVGVAAKSCNFIFDNCRFHNFLELGDAIVINVNSASSSTIHLILHSCTITGENVNTYARVLHINNGGNGYGVQLKVMQLITTNSAYESKKIGIVGAEKTADAYYGDGSAEYASSYIPLRFVQWGVQKQLSVVNNEVKYTLSDGETQLTLAQKSELATVATSGSYNDLTNKPTFQTLNLDGETAIQKNDDLNDYVTPGTFGTLGGHGASTVAASLSNCPVTIGFKMTVQLSGGSDDYIRQIIYGKNNTTYFRTGWKSSGSSTYNNWTSWSKVLQSVVSIADGGTGATTAANARTNLGLGSSATVDEDTEATASKIVKRTTNGSVKCKYLYTDAQTVDPANSSLTNSRPTFISDNGVLYKCSNANFLKMLGLEGFGVSTGSDSLGGGGYDWGKTGNICVLRITPVFTGTHNISSKNIPKPVSGTFTNGQHITITSTTLTIANGVYANESIMYICQ